jgi:hypothetical protein
MNKSKFATVEGKRLGGGDREKEEADTEGKRQANKNFKLCTSN